MNLNEAEIAVTTKRLVTVNPKKSYRMELADYCDIDEFQQDSFEQWCGHYGYNLATEDPHLLVSYFQDSPHARMVVREEEEPDVEEDNLVYQGISSYYSFVTSYPYEVFDDNYD